MLEKVEKNTSPFIGPYDRKRLKDAHFWVFDLDNTLYPAATDLFAQVDLRIRDYVADLLSLPNDEAYLLQKRYFVDYGTTMRGLMDNHGVDPLHYMDFVHDIDLSPVKPDAVLDAALERLPGRKVVFTNA